MMVKTDRISAYDAAPLAMEAKMKVESYINGCGLDPLLMELVKLRASQINGCAFCLDMHSKAARHHGEAEQRLHVLSAWRESSLFSLRERAALAWTEALTEVSESHAPDSLFNEVRQHFTDAELTHLTLLIGQINSWNRFAIGFGYQHP